MKPSPSLDALRNGDDPALFDLVEEMAARLQAGDSAAVEAWIAAQGDHADRLRRLLPTVQVMAELGSAAAGSASPPGPKGEPVSGVLGDFRMVRELGRGGMGVVYEAEQVSLRRRVALKVLPAAATLDPRRLQRFYNEAWAAASLHHTHIVPIFGVGCEGGVHYYAMQLIEGQTLAGVIRELRRQARGKRPAEAGADAEEGFQATTAYAPPPGAPAAESTAAQAALSTAQGVGSREYVRGVARLGAQAAEALDYAHQLGVVHRDVKPANLMVDGRGQLWVTDFGLAQVLTDTKLTLTGDLVGTLRYMSPEQALAKRVPIDHRTDVYSLGVTLYELLTLRPPFAGEDRQELLRQIAFEEPRPLRRLSRAVPVELQTIVLKAMEKNPAERYATAGELAEDLERFLKDEPIRARRPSLLQRLRKWGRRHRAAVRAGAAVLLLATVLCGGLGLWWLQKRTGAHAQAQAALEEEAAYQQDKRWPEALSAARRAQGVLAGFWADPALRRQADELAKDLEMAGRLEEARLRGTAAKDGHFDYEAIDTAYADAFAWYGLDVESLDPQEAAARIRARSIRIQLAAALDDWAYLRSKYGLGAWNHLVAVARAADPDRWRDRLRDALDRKDAKGLEEVAASVPNDELSATTAVLLSRLTHDTPMAERAVILLRQVQQRHPADFWVNERLGWCLAESRPPHLEEALRYYTAAVALRPQSPGAHFNLAGVLGANGQLEEAIAENREAIRFNKDYAEAHDNLGLALHAKGQLDEAIAEFREALRLKAESPLAHCNLGVALKDKGQFEEAIAEYRKALRLKTDYREAHNNLGVALSHTGRLDEALAEYREAIRINKDYAEAHSNLGVALMDRGQLEGAIAEYREALHLKKGYPEAHTNLGNALREKGRLDEALAEYREAIRINKDYAEAHSSLGVALMDRGQLEEAIAEYREALRLKPDLAEAHCSLGGALAREGHLDEAIAECREALRINNDLPGARDNLAHALAAKGQLDDAIAEYRELIRIKKDFAHAHKGLGDALLGKRQREEAIADYREALRLDKHDAEARNNLGAALADKGRLDEAIAEYREALSLDNDLPEAHNNLGSALMDKGQLDAAIAEYREALRLNKDYPEAHNGLGIAMADKGQLDDAIAEFREAIRIRPDLAPARNNLRQAEQFARLDSRLPGVLQGKDQPKDAAERLAFAQLCQQYRKQYTAAARFYSDAFAAEPALADKLGAAGSRYDAACAAALAGCGQGVDAQSLGEQERARLRRQALDWLRADLAAWQKLLEKEPDKARAAAAQQLAHWLEDTDFAGVRGPEALAKLPEAERRDWQKLWDDVEALRQRAAGHP